MAFYELLLHCPPIWYSLSGFLGYCKSRSISLSLSLNFFYLFLIVQFIYYEQMVIISWELNYHSTMLGQKGCRSKDNIALLDIPQCFPFPINYNLSSSLFVTTAQLLITCQLRKYILGNSKVVHSQLLIFCDTQVIQKSWFLQRTLKYLPEEWWWLSCFYYF